MRGGNPLKGLLDKEWLSLIREAKRIGLSIEEVRSFFQKDHTNHENVRIS
jgi:DNA-binding transcriptional MerR regulator